MSLDAAGDHAEAYRKIQLQAGTATASDTFDDMPAQMTFFSSAVRHCDTRFELFDKSCNKKNRPK